MLSVDGLKRETLQRIGTVSNRLDTGTVNLSASTVSTVVAPDVDEANRTQTYLALGPAGATSDFALVRQIGASDKIEIAIDYHDSSADGKFTLRSFGSIANPDPAALAFFKATTDRGFYNPRAALYRTQGTIGATDLSLETATGITKIFCYGANHNKIVLPSTLENGIEIHVINLTDNDITVDAAQSPLATSIVKNVAFTTVDVPSSANSSVVPSNRIGVYYATTSTTWLGYLMTVAKFA